jgi:hypothetical protein
MADAVRATKPAAEKDRAEALGQPAALRQLLVSRGVSAGASDDDLLDAASSPDHKLKVTLLSAMATAGQELSPGQQAELSDNRHRIERYRVAWSIVSAAAPDAFVVKGTSISSRYPAGLIRSAGDMDVIGPSDQLWLAARALLAEGWQLFAFTIFRGLTPADSLEVLMELSQPSDTSIEEPYGVELRTLDVGTSIVRPPVRLTGQLPQVAASVLALAAERWERPFRTRDIYDLAVLHEYLDAAERASLADGLTATGLWPAMQELSDLLVRSGLRPAPDLPGSRRGVRRARARWLAQAVIRIGNPVRALGFLSLRTVDHDRGAFADRLAQATHKRVGSWRLHRRGLPLFAVPLPEDAALEEAAIREAAATETRLQVAASGAKMRLVRFGPHVVALTPVGPFLMVAGACPETWLDEAAAALRAALGVTTSS